MNAPFLLPGPESRTTPDRPPALPAKPSQSNSSEPESRYEAELAAELASVLRRQPRGPRSVPAHRPASARREPAGTAAFGNSLKHRLDSVDWRDGQALPPPADADIAAEPETGLKPDSGFHTTVSGGYGSSEAWLRKARRDRQLARVSHAVSWAVTLVIGGAIFAAVAVMLFGPGRVMAALNKLPLLY